MSEPVYGFEHEALQEKQALEAAQIEKEDMIQDFQTVFGSDAGGRVLAFLIDYGFQNKPTYTPGDSHHTALREGQRKMVLKILSYLHVSDLDLLERARQRRSRRMGE